MQQANSSTGTQFDLIVVGGGPAGTTAALYAARAGIRTLVVDKGAESSALGLARRIANYPGTGGELSGEELLGKMRQQASAQGAAFVQDRAIASLLGQGEQEIVGAEGSYRGRALVVATGALGREASVPGEQRLLGKGVGYCATCDAAFFRDKTVAVVGGSEEAAEEGLLVAKFAQTVHLVVPAGALKARGELANEVQAHPGVEVHVGTSLREILGADRVEGLRLKPKGGEEYTLAVDGVFIYLQGARPVVDFLGGQLELTPKGYVLVDEWFAASVPGVFAAGDVVGPRLRQVVVAAAQGAQAAMAAERYVSGRAKVRPDWS